MALLEEGRGRLLPTAEIFKPFSLKPSIPEDVSCGRELIAISSRRGRVRPQPGFGRGNAAGEFDVCKLLRLEKVPGGALETKGSSLLAPQDMNACL